MICPHCEGQVSAVEVLEHAYLPHPMGGNQDLGEICPICKEAVQQGDWKYIMLTEENEVIVYSFNDGVQSEIDTAGKLK